MATQPVSGTAVKGPVSGGTVTAYAIANGTVGAQLGSGTTDSQGNFTMAIGTYSGPLMLQMQGGSYTDEATNTTMTMHAGDVLTSVIPALTSGSPVTGVQITPLTSMAQARAHAMTGGMTEANITTANTAMGTYFSVNDILHTPPMNPLASGAGASASPEMKNYGMAIAAMSQYASTLGMPISSGMVTALMADAADGTLDGLTGTTPITMSGMGGMMGGGTMQTTTGTSGMAAALTTFVNNPTINKSGLTMADMQTLITKMNSASGQLQGAGSPSLNGMISGTAVMGQFGGGTVAAFAVDNGVKAAQVASSAMDTHGNFTMPVGAYSGPLMLQVSGGTYMDLATGSTMTMAANEVMTSVISSFTAGSTVSGMQITPLTSMAQIRAQTMTGGMTAANISAANAAVSNYFTVNDILSTQPLDPSVAGSGATASQDMRNYGMVIAAISQEANTLGMPHSSGMVTTMMQDAADGVMNGMVAGGTPISMNGMGGGAMNMGNMQATAGTSGLASAMTTFMNNTSVNKSGLTAAAMQTLIAKMSSANGIIQ